MPLLPVRIASPSLQKYEPYAGPTDRHQRDRWLARWAGRILLKDHEAQRKRRVKAYSEWSFQARKQIRFLSEVMKDKNFRCDQTRILKRGEDAWAGGRSKKGLQGEFIKRLQQVGELAKIYNGGIYTEPAPQRGRLSLLSGSYMRTKHTVASLYGELRVADMDHKLVFLKDGIACRVRDVTLIYQGETFYLGDFWAGFSWSSLGTAYFPKNSYMHLVTGARHLLRSSTKPFAIPCDETKTCRSRIGDHPHPHVTADRVCLGNGKNAFWEAVAHLRIADAFQTLKNLLWTYNHSGPYCELNRWHQKFTYCRACHRTLNASNNYDCASGDHGVCDECVLECDLCGEDVCKVCARTCRRCSASRCPDCIEKESKCVTTDRYGCPSCLPRSECCECSESLCECCNCYSWGQTTRCHGCQEVLHKSCAIYLDGFQEYCRDCLNTYIRNERQYIGDIAQAAATNLPYLHGRNVLAVALLCSGFLARDRVFRSYARGRSRSDGVILSKASGDRWERIVRRRRPSGLSGTDVNSGVPAAPVYASLDSYPSQWMQNSFRPRRAHVSEILREMSLGSHGYSTGGPQDNCEIAIQRGTGQFDYASRQSPPQGSSRPAQTYWQAMYETTPR